MPEYIEREALLDIAKKVADMYSVTGLAAPKIIKLIEKAPKVDVVEVKHGEWDSSKSHFFLGGNLYFECSVCGESDPWQGTTRGHAHYCPNCGAKMDKKEGAEE